MPCVECKLNVLRSETLIEVHLGRVMVNFMSLLDWAWVPRYMVKHYSGCFHECVLDESNI